MYRIAVIGDADSVLGFQTLGLEVCPVNSADEARQSTGWLGRTTPSSTLPSSWPLS